MPTIPYRKSQRFEDTSPTVLDNPLEKLFRAGKRGANWLSDLIGGSTPEEEAQTAVASLANPIGGPLVTTVGSSLRNAAYRSQLLRALGDHIGAADVPRGAKKMLLRLLDTHPRVMSAFQHAGGTITRDPKYGPGTVKRLQGRGYKARKHGALASDITERHLGWDTPPEAVEGLRNVTRNPVMMFTPEDVVPSSTKASVIDMLGREGWGSPNRNMFAETANTAAHETTHWGQALGSRKFKEWKALRYQPRWLQAEPDVKRRMAALNDAIEGGARKGGRVQSGRLLRYQAEQNLPNTRSLLRDLGLSNDDVQFFEHLAQEEGRVLSSDDIPLIMELADLRK